MNVDVSKWFWRTQRKIKSRLVGRQEYPVWKVKSLDIGGERNISRRKKSKWCFSNRLSSGRWSVYLCADWSKRGCKTSGRCKLVWKFIWRLSTGHCDADSIWVNRTWKNQVLWYNKNNNNVLKQKLYFGKFGKGNDMLNESIKKLVTYGMETRLVPDCQRNYTINL